MHFKRKLRPQFKEKKSNYIEIRTTSLKMQDSGKIVDKTEYQAPPHFVRLLWQATLGKGYLETDCFIRGFFKNKIYCFKFRDRDETDRLQGFISFRNAHCFGFII